MSSSSEQTTSSAEQLDQNQSLEPQAKRRRLIVEHQMKGKQHENARYNISRTDLVRVMVQALQSLDLSESADILEKESGIQLHDPPISQFRQNVLSGDWESVMNSLDVLKIMNEENEHSVKYLIGKQRYLECLEESDSKQALEILRDQVTPHSNNPTQLHKLASLLTCTSLDNLYRRANWDGRSGMSRRELLNDLHRYISPSLMVPENRLEKLLMQAIYYQRENHMIDSSEATAGDIEISLLQEDVHPSHVAPCKCIYTFEDHKDEVWGVQFSPNGRYLASCSADRTAIIYDLSANKSIYKHVEHINHTRRTQQSTSRSDEVNGGDFDFIPIVCEGHVGKVTSLAWNPTSDRLLTCSEDKTIRLWNTGGACLHTFSKHKNAICQVGWSHDGKYIISASTVDKTFLKWNATTFECMEKYSADYQIQDFVIRPKAIDRMCAVTSNRIHVFHLENHEDQFTLQDSLSIASAVFSNCGRYLLCSQSSNSSAIAQSTETVSLESAESSSTNTSTDHLAKLHLWDLNERRIVKEFTGHKQTKYVLRPCFSSYPSRAFVCCGSEDGSIYLWNAEDGTLLQDMPLCGHVGPVNSVSWHPKAQIIASASDDGTVRLWGSTSSIRK